MPREFTIVVQMNTDTVGHNPLCSLRERGYNVWTMDLTFMREHRVIEILGVTVTGPEEPMAYEVLCSHPAIISVTDI